jgi:hypothetical protein
MRKILRYTLRTLLGFLLLLSLIVVFMLNPQLVYAKKHSYKQLTIYSKDKYPPGYDKVFDSALKLVQQSELYKPDLKLDIFLNDGSGASVKFVLKQFFGNAFAWGYHNNVVLNGTTDDSLKWCYINGYSRYLPRLIAHEMIHCYQLKKLGLYNASPYGDVPIWKREGYAEYICYKSSVKNEQQMLFEAIKKYNEQKEKDSFVWATVNIDEGESYAGKDYYRFWILVKYLCDVRKLSFDELIKGTIKEESVYGEMMEWYKNQFDTTLQYKSK